MADTLSTTSSPFHGYLREVLDGKAFNAIRKSWTGHPGVVACKKLTNAAMCHNSYQYTEKELNVDNREFKVQQDRSSGGFYFCTYDHVPFWRNYNSSGEMEYIFEVTIPDDAKVYIESIDRFKCDRFILGERSMLDEWEGWSDERIIHMCEVSGRDNLKYCNSQRLSRFNQISMAKDDHMDDQRLADIAVYSDPAGIHGTTMLTKELCLFAAASGESNALDRLIKDGKNWPMYYQLDIVMTAWNNCKTTDLSLFDLPEAIIEELFITGNMFSILCSYTEPHRRQLVLDLCAMDRDEDKQKLLDKWICRMSERELICLVKTASRTFLSIIIRNKKHTIAMCAEARGSSGKSFFTELMDEEMRKLSISNPNETSSASFDHHPVVKKKSAAILPSAGKRTAKAVTVVVQHYDHGFTMMDFLRYDMSLINKVPSHLIVTSPELVEFLTTLPPRYVSCVQLDKFDLSIARHVELIMKNPRLLANGIINKQIHKLSLDVLIQIAKRIKELSLSPTLLIRADMEPPLSPSMIMALAAIDDEYVTCALQDTDIWHGPVLDLLQYVKAELTRDEICSFYNDHVIALSQALGTKHLSHLIDVVPRLIVDYTEPSWKSRHLTQAIHLQPSLCVEISQSKSSSSSLLLSHYLVAVHKQPTIIEQLPLHVIDRHIYQAAIEAEYTPSDAVGDACTQNEMFRNINKRKHTAGEVVLPYKKKKNDEADDESVISIEEAASDDDDEDEDEDEDKSDDDDEQPSADMSDEEELTVDNSSLHHSDDNDDDDDSD